MRSVNQVTWCIGRAVTYAIVTDPEKILIKNESLMFLPSLKYILYYVNILYTMSNNESCLTCCICQMLTPYNNFHKFNLSIQNLRLTTISDPVFERLGTRTTWQPLCFFCYKFFIQVLVVCQKRSFWEL